MKSFLKQCFKHSPDPPPTYSFQQKLVKIFYVTGTKGSSMFQKKNNEVIDATHPKFLPHQLSLTMLKKTLTMSRMRYKEETWA